MGIKIRDFDEVEKSYRRASGRTERFGIAANTIFGGLFSIVFGGIFGGMPLFLTLIPLLTAQTAEPEGARWIGILFVSVFVVIGFGIAFSGFRRIIKMILLIKNAPPLASVPAEATSDAEAPMPSLKEAFGKMISAVREHRRGNIITPADDDSDAEKMTWKSRLIALIFGLIFFAAGAGVFGFGVTQYLKNQRAAKTWISVPCEIVSAEIEKHRSRGKHGSNTSYSPELTFRYRYDGKTFTGNEETLTSELSMDYPEAAAELKKLKKYTSCWIDPENPADAVLKKPDAAFSFEKIIPIVFGLPFLVMGATVAGFGIFGNRFRKKREAERGEILPEEKSGAQSVLFPVLWNLILSVFICVCLANPGRFWFFWIILIPFLIIGIFLAFSAFKAVRSKFNGIRYVIALKPESETLVAGTPVRVHWKLRRGDPEKFSRLTLSFLESERDKDMQVNGKAVLKVVERTMLCESGSRVDLRSGACDFIPPEDHPTIRRFFAFELVLEPKSSLRGKVTLRFPVKLIGKKPEV